MELLELREQMRIGLAPIEEGDGVPTSTRCVDELRTHDGGSTQNEDLLF